MSDEAALLNAIYANPDEDTPRLMYADWLDEHDQPERAEFIRVQIELANRDDEKTNEFRSLNERESALWETHWKKWTEGLAPGNHVQFIRGFPEIVVVDNRDGTPTDFGFLHRLPLIRRLEVRDDLDPNGLSIIAGLQHLETLRIWTPLDPSWLEFLDPLPCWTYAYANPLSWDAREEWEAFQERRISKVTLLTPDQQRLAAIRYVRGLNWDNRSLRLDRAIKTVQMWNINTIDAELRMLAYLPELEEIEIHRCNVTTAGLRHLSDLPNLKKINLSETRCESLVPLMNCTTLEQLEYVPDGGVTFGDESVVGLERLTNLRQLDLRPQSWGLRSGLRDATLRRIGALRQLRHLCIELGTCDEVRAETALASILENENSLGALSNLIELEFLCLNEVEYTGDELRQFLVNLRRQ